MLTLQLAEMEQSALAGFTQSQHYNTQLNVLYAASEFGNTNCSINIIWGHVEAK
jgi:hypothetical protein